MFQRTVHVFYPIAFILLTLSGCAQAPSKQALDELNAEQLYHGAQYFIRHHQYQRATESLESLETNFPFSALAQKSELLLIYTHFHQRAYDSAIHQGEQFLTYHPNHPHLDYVHYIQGLSYMHQSNDGFSRFLPQIHHKRDITPLRAAFFHFSTVLKQFPDSRYAPDARQRMIYIKHILAAQQLKTAEHYYKQGAYSGTIHRIQGLLRDFKDTPAAHEALWLLKKTFEKTHQTAQAEQLTLQLQTPH